MEQQASQTVLQSIHDLLSTVRVYINYDGGDVEFVSYTDQILTLKISGACSTCPFNNETFDAGVKQVFMAEIPEIKDVKFVI